MERLKEKKIHVTPVGFAMAIGSLLGKFHPFGIVWRHCHHCEEMKFLLNRATVGLSSPMERLKEKKIHVTPAGFG
jgi:hypothetical protein